MCARKKERVASVSEKKYILKEDRAIEDRARIGTNRDRWRRKR
jgi:hypothetical protein